MSQPSPEVDVRQLFTNVRARPRMFVPDVRYATVVGFVAGVDQATGLQLLDGFGRWLATRHENGSPSIAWWSQIVQMRFRDHATRPRVADLDEVDSAPLIDDLFSMLDAVLAERE